MPNARHAVRCAAIALLMLVGAIQGAGADQIDLTNPAFAPIGNPTSIPVGHAEFCKSHRDECGVNANAVPMTILTEARWQQLLQVNAVINAAVVPITDMDYYKVSEYWAYPNGYGDCEDFVLAKRKALIESGWNASTLLITVVRERNGNGHAVLTVRTDRGDLVLDNQDSRVLLWNETPYQFLKRQSQASAGKWVDIIDNVELRVAASH